MMLSLFISTRLLSSFSKERPQEFRQTANYPLQGHTSTREAVMFTAAIEFAQIVMAEWDRKL